MTSVLQSSLHFSYNSRLLKITQPHEKYYDVNEYKNWPLAQIAVNFAATHHELAQTGTRGNHGKQNVPFCTGIIICLMNVLVRERGRAFEEPANFAWVDSDLSRAYPLIVGTQYFLKLLPLRHAAWDAQRRIDRWP